MAKKIMWRENNNGEEKWRKKIMKEGERQRNKMAAIIEKANEIWLKEKRS